jgi:hypothetical protein
VDAWEEPQDEIDAADKSTVADRTFPEERVDFIECKKGTFVQYPNRKNLAQLTEAELKDFEEKEWKEGSGSPCRCKICAKRRENGFEKQEPVDLDAPRASRTTERRWAGYGPGRRLD